MDWQFCPRCETQMQGEVPTCPACGYDPSDVEPQTVADDGISYSQKYRDLTFVAAVEASRPRQGIGRTRVLVTVVVMVPSIRQADGEYGITLAMRNVSQLVDIEGLTLTIWGTPWSVLHNDQRGDCLNEVEPTFGWSKCSVGRPLRRENTPIAYPPFPPPATPH